MTNLKSNGRLPKSKILPKGRSKPNLKILQYPQYPPPKSSLKPARRAEIDAVCVELVDYQRQREIIIKSRIKQTNRLLGLVATADFYYNSNSTSVEERTKIFKEVNDHIDAVVAGKAGSKLKDVILVTRTGVDAFLNHEVGLKVLVEIAVAKLHVYPWLCHPDRRGIAEGLLGQVIGETGNLFNYSCPGKVHRRLGCNPHAYGGYTHMGSTWMKKRTKISLPADEWVKFGYSPRRRKVAWLVGNNIEKSNKGGPYRTLYDEIRSTEEIDHPDWTPKHRQLHAMLLATKELLKDLWIEWWK